MAEEPETRSDASPMDVETDEVCWICLDDNSSDTVLMSPCKCPRKVHPRCMARWQLQQAGRPEETHCRFCNSELADWKASLTPESLKPEVQKVQPIMVVYFEGEIHRIPVKQGNEGLREFTHRIRELFRLPEDVDISLTFGCKEPLSGQHLKLEGIGAFDAAVHCASVAAAERQQKTKSGGGAGPDGPPSPGTSSQASSAGGAPPPASGQPPQPQPQQHAAAPPTQSAPTQQQQPASGLPVPYPSSGGGALNSMTGPRRVPPAATLPTPREIAHRAQHALQQVGALRTHQGQQPQQPASSQPASGVQADLGSNPGGGGGGGVQHSRPSHSRSRSFGATTMGALAGGPDPALRPGYAAPSPEQLQASLAPPPPPSTQSQQSQQHAARPAGTHTGSYLALPPLCTPAQAAAARQASLAESLEQPVTPCRPPSLPRAVRGSSWPAPRTSMSGGGGALSVSGGGSGLPACAAPQTPSQGATPGGSRVGSGGGGASCPASATGAGLGCGPNSSNSLALMPTPPAVPMPFDSPSMAPSMRRQRRSSGHAPTVTLPVPGSSLASSGCASPTSHTSGSHASVVSSGVSEAEALGGVGSLTGRLKTTLKSFGRKVARSLHLNHPNSHHLTAPMSATATASTATTTLSAGGAQTAASFPLVAAAPRVTSP